MKSAQTKTPSLGATIRQSLGLSQNKIVEKRFDDFMKRHINRIIDGKSTDPEDIRLHTHIMTRKLTYA
jgi:hypothetical protein